jgi:epoxyqueuosine reductase
MSLGRAALTRALKERALALGFDRVAVGPAWAPEHGAAFEAWLGAGHAGGMSYLERGRARRLDPGLVLPGARSMVLVALNYYQGDPPAGEGWRAVARYAWGEDYHRVMIPRLQALLAFLREAGGAGIEGKAYVDTGPLLERDLAARAGLGWIGKNTMLLHPELGSWFFIGALLTTADLDPDEALPDRCGTCRACLEACPTGAFPAPYILDARRCISYLTIEHRGSIPEDLRPLVGEWLFGCDICQEVCPWNRKAPRTREAAFLPRGEPPGLRDLVEMTEEEWRARVGGTALTRPKRGGLLRNAAVVAGNQKAPEAIPALRRALGDPDPVVREQAAWALARIAGDERPSHGTKD